MKNKLRKENPRPRLECGGACQDYKVLKKSEAGEAMSISGGQGEVLMLL